MFDVVDRIWEIKEQKYEKNKKEVYKGSMQRKYAKKSTQR
jgi:hypothetical protein